MKNKIWGTIVMIVIAALAVSFVTRQSSNNAQHETEQRPQQQTPVTVNDTDLEPASVQKDDLIRVDTPKSNQTVSSPLAVSGAARGQWYFEASFPVRLEDARGAVLAQGAAQAQGEWTTTEYVPFTIMLSFIKPTTRTGYLILEKDNPSGLPENANELRLPVQF